MVVAALPMRRPWLRNGGAAMPRWPSIFRDKGQHAFADDSMTRYAMAPKRELPWPLSRQPPRVIRPRALANCPNWWSVQWQWPMHGVGSITAFNTVLSEGDDQQDPIADAAGQFWTGTSCCPGPLAETWGISGD